MTDLAATGAQCFISYHRRDNELYGGVVDRIKNEIEGRFEAETGRTLTIFLDRESIPGGGDWRENISASIESATILIPVVTMRYFQSDACRQELLAFFDGAEQLGVTDLIIPVVLAGSGSISADDPRPEVRLIERLNYRSIEDAWEAGYESAQWKTAIRTLVTDVSAGLLKAEDAIAAREAASSGIDQSSVDALVATEVATDVGDEDVPDEEEAGLFEIKQEIAELTVAAQEGGALLAKLGEITVGLKPEVDRAAGGNPQQQRALLLRIAAEISPTCAELGLRGAQLETGVRRTDKRLRRLTGELKVMKGEVAASYRAQLFGAVGSVSLTETIEQMDSMSATLQAFALTSVSIRRAIAPAIRGVRSIRNAISIVDSWDKLI